jgi:hypothetical protein
MNPTSSKNGTSWLRDFIENSAAVVAVMTPEIKHGLRVARNAISSRAGGHHGVAGARTSRQREAVSHSP